MLAVSLVIPYEMLQLRVVRSAVFKAFQRALVHFYPPADPQYPPQWKGVKGGSNGRKTIKGYWKALLEHTQNVSTEREIQQCMVKYGNLEAEPRGSSGRV